MLITASLDFWRITMEKSIEYERTAFYYETDRMNVIHHSNYIRWFEEARIHFMDKVGYPYARMEKEGIMMPVLSAVCEYKNSVKFGDTVVIKTAISEFNGFKMTIQYLVNDKTTGELRAKGSTSHCFTDMEMKPVRIKNKYPELYDLYSKYVINTP